MSFPLLKKPFYATTAACLTAASALHYYYYYNTTSPGRPTCQQMAPIPPYEATLSVPMTCHGCTTEISNALSTLPGIQSTSFSIPSKLVTVRSSEAPSRIISAIQSTGRAAILRGSGDPNSAAVCILETPTPQPSPVRGLVRLIELGDSRMTMLDLTLTGMRRGRYRASVRVSGDISDGKGSMGGVFSGLEGDREGEIGELVVDREGRGALIGEIGWRVWEMVGRGVVVEKLEGTDGRRDRDQGDSIAIGVIARSAGVWENEKVVCGCSGKTVWEERKEMVERGIS